MIFYNDKQPNSTVVSKGKRIAHFVDGEFETKNKIIIDKLKKHFKFGDGKGNKVKAKVLSYWELKLKAEAMGIKTHKMKRIDIEKALSEKNKTNLKKVKKK